MTMKILRPATGRFLRCRGRADDVGAPILARGRLGCHHSTAPRPRRAFGIALLREPPRGFLKPFPAACSCRSAVEALEVRNDGLIDVTAFTGVECRRASRLGRYPVASGQSAVISLQPCFCPPVLFRFPL